MFEKIFKKQEKTQEKTQQKVQTEQKLNDQDCELTDEEMDQIVGGAKGPFEPSRGLKVTTVKQLLGGEMTGAEGAYIIHLRSDADNA